MKYESGYKYQLEDDQQFQTDIFVDKDILFDWCSLNKYGILFIKKGYAWDGPSGPTFDTKDFMLGSLAHDALYQLIANGFIDKKFRINADNLLRKICLEKGMPKLRAFYVYWAVRLFGGSHLMKDKVKEA